MVLVRRFVRVLIVLLAVMAVGAMVSEAVAQTKKKPATGEKSTKKEPTKEETEEYIVMMIMEHMGAFHDADAKVNKAEIKDCLLEVESERRKQFYSANDNDCNGSESIEIYSYSVNMRDLDIGKVNNDSAPCRPGVRCVQRTWKMEQRCLLKQNTIYNSADTSNITTLTVTFRDENNAGRFARALRHEAKLCGARDSSTIKKDLF